MYDLYDTSHKDYYTGPDDPFRVTSVEDHLTFRTIYQIQFGNRTTTFQVSSDVVSRYPDLVKQELRDVKAMMIRDILCIEELKRI